MSRALNDLSPRFKPKAFEFLARCVEAGVAVMVVDTLRTPEEQAANVAKGVSWTLNSKHLTGDAIDVCPFETFALHGPDKLQWDANDPVWGKLGAIGELVGLKWGVWVEKVGDYPIWRRRGKFVNIDPGHFEFKL